MNLCSIFPSCALLKPFSIYILIMAEFSPVLFTFLLVGFVYVYQTSAYCYNTDTNPNRNYTTKTPYEPSQGYDPDSPRPQGCVPVQLWLLARHGTRYISTSQMEQMKKFLYKLKQDIMDNVILASLCQEDLYSLHAWLFRMDPEDHMRQSETGWEELKGLGRRFRNKFGDLFVSSYDENLYLLRHSNYTGDGDRTKDSAKAFAEGFFGYYDSVKISEQESPDWLLKFYNLCDKYKREVSRQPIAEYEKFKTAPYTRDMFLHMEQRLGLPEGHFSFDDIDLLHDACRVEYGVYQDAPWCMVFDSNAINVMEYGDDLLLYWRELYGHEINTQPACPLMVDLFDHFEIPLKNPRKKLVSSFAHSPTVNMFFAQLGLFRDDEPLLADDYNKRTNRIWRSTLYQPMTSNIAFVLYQCGNEYKIQTFVNEELIRLPDCEIDCAFETFKQLYGQIADDCDINTICDMPPDPTSLGSRPSSWVYVWVYSTMVVSQFFFWQIY